MAEGGSSVKNLRLEEEQRLSTAVFFGLYALTQAHKPTAEFQKVFQKVNMKYLDPGQKEFYWLSYFVSINRIYFSSQMQELYLM